MRLEAPPQLLQATAQGGAEAFLQRLQAMGAVRAASDMQFARHQEAQEGREEGGGSVFQVCFLGRGGGGVGVGSWCGVYVCVLCILRGTRMRVGLLYVQRYALLTHLYIYPYLHVHKHLCTHLHLCLHTNKHLYTNTYTCNTHRHKL